MQDSEIQKSPGILAELGEYAVYAFITREVKSIALMMGLLGIKYVTTSCKATAAGCNVMSHAEQTKSDISFRIGYSKKSISLKLGRLIVVKNLGVELLLGEPGKGDCDYSSQKAN